jgi:hypothetical protein
LKVPVTRARVQVSRAAGFSHWRPARGIMIMMPPGQLDWGILKTAPIMANSSEKSFNLILSLRNLER